MIAADDETDGGANDELSTGFGFLDTAKVIFNVILSL